MADAVAPGDLARAVRLGDWLSVGPDGRVTARTGKVEFGQGIRTVVAQIVADALDVPIERIDVAPVVTGISPDEGVTSGSRSTQDVYEVLGRVAFAARRALLAAAARRLGVSPETLTTSAGLVVARDGRSIPYGELAEEVLNAPFRPEDGAVETTRRSVVGQSVPRLDLPAKVRGEPVFVQDLDLPGMLHGRVVRPPDPGARLVEVDVASIREMPGVREVVRDGSFLAVICGREDEAVRAARRAQRVARWTSGPDLPRDGGFLLEAEPRDVVVRRRDDGAERPAGRRIEAEYRRPYLAHASLGPSCAVARFEDGRYEVWSHSQGPYHLRQELAKVLHKAPADVRVIHVEGAGCYGANGADDAALDAALLARAMPGVPVRVQWMREDEAAWEPFGTPMVIRLAAVLDERGEVVDWQHDVWGNGHRDRPGLAAGDRVTNLLAARHLGEPFAPTVAAPPAFPGSGSGRNAAPPYSFPSERVVNHYVPFTPVRVSALRSLGAHANVFAIESFVDEIALATGADPLAWRLAHLSDPRARAVLERVARASDWRAARSASAETGLGIAYARYKGSGSHVAIVVEATAEDDLRLLRVWACVDAGLVVNPDGLRNQAEGGILQAASWTLREAVKLQGPEITSLTWDDYPVLRFAEVPEVRVELIDQPSMAPLGVGEAFAGPTAAAIANACYAATGIRLREMPFTRERFLAAISR